MNNLYIWKFKANLSVPHNLHGRISGWKTSTSEVKQCSVSEEKASQTVLQKEMGLLSSPGEPTS